MAISINQSLNNMNLDENSRKALAQVLGALYDYQVVLAQSLDADAGVTATDAKAKLDLLIKE